MSLLYSSEKYFSIIKDYFKNSQDIVLFVPYIQRNVLAELLLDLSKGVCSTIITSWKPRDVALGVSDIDVYNFCKERDIVLLINNRIHLKAYVLDDFSKCIVTSSNISGSGLATKPYYNYELGAIVEDLNLNDKLYFDMIIEESDEVTQSYYDQVKEQTKYLALAKEMKEEFDIIQNLSSKDFLLTSLPMSDTVEQMFDIYRGNTDYPDEILRSAEHDLRIYNIKKGLPKEKFYENFTKSYFKHPFIKTFLEYNGDGKYYGELSRWLHNTCTTVPTPRRYEIKEALKRIFNFTSALDESYKVIIPGSRSEMLKRISC